ncbi:MAG: amino acid ABC transporter substrate-binding protein [Anaerolineae bacterium]|nr:amino acid ABC transporter substrate-binding protein [Anaerolineae bacterium]
MHRLRNLGVMLLLLAMLCACEGKADPLARIESAGVLRVAMDPSYPPFEFLDENNEFAGLDVELAREIAKRMGVEVQFVAIGYDALYDALMMDKADVIISALYPDPNRTSAFVFSPSYFNAGEVVVVPETSQITKISDLAGQRVALVFGTEGHSVVLQWEKVLSPPPQVLTADLPDVAIGVVAAGVADAAVVDNVSTRIALTQMSGLRVLDVIVSNEPYVVAARLEDNALMKVIDDVLVQIKEDGTLDQILYRWLR